tara:strand:+ start:438 stop:617 length:180 start_codon:yes stop_codon:yes gene_type:complete
MIVKSYHRPNVYFLFRDNNTEVEFSKRQGVPPKAKHYKLSQNDKKTINNYFKLTINETL